MDDRSDTIIPAVMTGLAITGPIRRGPREKTAADRLALEQAETKRARRRARNLKGVNQCEV